MDTISKTDSGTERLVGPITAEDINRAFDNSLEELSAFGQSSQELFKSWVIVGRLLAAKRKEFPPRAGWYEWLATNCTDISRQTCDRLMGIAELYRSNPSGIKLDVQCRSIEGLYLAMKGQTETPTKEKSDTPPPSRVIASLARFWTAITRRPASEWDETERSEFLTDLAERERIRKENGWDLPTIDVESETLN